VIVELGANDGLRGMDLKETRANLERIIERLLAGDTKVIVAGMKLPPNYGREYTGGFQSLYPELAKAYKVPLMPFFLEGVATKVDLNQPDGLHPTKAGYTIIVNSLWPVLEPLLQK
jgi:acyl-CoA thioesterase-1